jgi:hypothetical protein
VNLDKKLLSLSDFLNWNYTTVAWFPIKEKQNIVYETHKVGFPSHHQIYNLTPITIRSWKLKSLTKWGIEGKALTLEFFSLQDAWDIAMGACSSRHLCWSLSNQEFHLSFKELKICDNTYLSHPQCMNPNLQHFLRSYTFKSNPMATVPFKCSWCCIANAQKLKTWTLLIPNEVFLRGVAGHL